MAGIMFQSVLVSALFANFMTGEQNDEETN